MFAQFTLLIKTRTGTVGDLPAEYVVCGQNASSCSFQSVSVEGLSDPGESSWSWQPRTSRSVLQRPGWVFWGEN